MRTQNIGRWWRKGVVALLSVPVALGVCAQAVPPALPQAGQLLEEQRRAAEQREQAPAPGGALLDAASGAPTPAAVAGGDTRFIVRSFSLSGHSVFDTAKLQAVLADWVGREIGLADLRQASAAIEALYRQSGWLARVLLPSQDITEGTVRLQVAEARSGTVTRVPAEPAPASLLGQRVERMVQHSVVSGTPLDLAALESALILANELPGVRVAGSLSAGAAEGSTDVLLQLSPTPPARFDLYVDNAGSSATGSVRSTALLTLDSPTGQGEQLGATVSRTQGSEFFRGSLSLPVGDRGLRLAAQGSVLRYRVLNEFNTTTGAPPQGSADTVGLDLQWPVLRRAGEQWTGTLGLEGKRQANLHGDTGLGAPDPTVRSRHDWLHLGLHGHRIDRDGGGSSTQARLQLSTGRLSLAGSPTAHVDNDSRTAATQGRTDKLRYSVSRVQQLGPQQNLHLGLSGQLARRNLDAGERFYLGGVGGVHAYPSGEAGGSQGQLVNAELRHSFAPHRSGQWQAGVLADWGQVEVYRRNERADGAGPLASDNRHSLKGVGARLSWRGESGAFASAVLARRVGINPLATPAGTDTDGTLRKHRFWLSAGISF